MQLHAIGNKRITFASNNTTLKNDLQIFGKPSFLSAHSFASLTDNPQAWLRQVDYWTSSLIPKDQRFFNFIGLYPSLSQLSKFQVTHSSAVKCLRAGLEKYAAAIFKLPFRCVNLIPEKFLLIGLHSW